ncbi:class I SAM-dependent methyltransferase [Hydrogenimonas thermophila]|uniref:Methyltransferase domain-containing protein n=1 Tax=Hydrogenimonas thermophila TaxID=223786 RepID=A0A1I5MKZ0_9BACT|nr:class I SAM-dependent methyltransferase [Hydrogenimonas thermophila]SFP09977.1 Methyltransferase domain-containing protein [Hydrogenimonas thermophila]
MGLELYAKIEPILGFEESIEGLYDFYIELLKSWNPDTLIDIGCGSGAFLKRLSQNMELSRVYGIDLSKTMVERAKLLGLDADAKDLCDVKESFDVATAVFDVLNYLDFETLEQFMGCVYKVLKPGGIFIADINTLFGFEEVAQGSLIREDEKRFVTLDSVFDNGILTTNLTLFEEENSGCYRKSNDTIVQHYHETEKLANLGGLVLVQSYPIEMYADIADKEVLVFKREA